MKACCSLSCLLGACILLVVGLSIMPMASSNATVPQLINYQGKLTKASGAPLDTSISMIFTIYADSGGTISKWSESQIVVKVEKGVFNVFLGNVNPIPDSVFDGSIKYLGVKVGTDPEITPRKKVVSVAYAYRSVEADIADYARALSGTVDNTDKVDGLHASSAPTAGYLYPLDGSAKIPNARLYTGSENGLDADLLDGEHALAFLTPAQDYGRPGVTSDLYEGASTLTSTYVNEGQAAGGDLTGAFPNPVIAGNAVTTIKIQDGTIVRSDVTSDFKAPYSDTADYARGGVTDRDWAFRLTEGNDTTLITKGAWGIARYDNSLEGNADSTHVNLGVSSTTGRLTYNHKYCTVAGGVRNWARFSFATVSGGGWNTANGDSATVGGGCHNVATGSGATVAGGSQNTATGDYAPTVGGGRNNTANGENTTIAGGAYNFSGGGATVGGGVADSATGWSATIGGGGSNIASADYATVGGGWSNNTTNEGTTVGGGQYNTASGNNATVAGGYTNKASGVGATVAGGYGNSASGNYSAIAGGENDTASGDHSFTAGEKVKLTSDADHTFAFGYDFTTSTDSAVIFFVSGNEVKVGIQTTNPTNILTIKRDSGTDPIADDWTTYPSPPEKTGNIQQLTSSDYQEALRKLTSVPLVKFYNTGGDSREKIGILSAEMPAEILAEGHLKAISLSGYMTLLHAALKAQQERIETLEAKLQKVESQR